MRLPGVPGRRIFMCNDANVISSPEKVGQEVRAGP